MGKPYWALVLAVFTAFVGEPARAKPGDLGLVTEFYLNQRYEFPCPASVAEATPKWKEGDEIPLSPKAAVQAARAEMKTLFADAADWTLIEVKLTNCADADHWYYLVCFSSPDKRTEEARLSGHPVPSFSVPVLLNGVVVPPDITDVPVHQ